jgi:hypothetical protein
MAYQISYYFDRAMRYSQSDADNIGEAIDRYPAPRGTETAFARHSENRELDTYGYDGAWHRHPPQAVYEAEKRRTAIIAAREEAEGYARRPHVVGRLANDKETFLISVPGQSQPVYLRIADLRQAAAQDDPEGPAVYGRLLSEIKEKLTTDWR